MRLEARGISVRYGATVALDNASVSVEPGRTLVVMGPNGAGKSTLMRVLALLQPRDGGEVLVDGVSPTPATAGRLLGRIVCSFQSPLMVKGSVRFNAELGARLAGKTEAGRRAAEAMDRLGVARLADRRAADLSGGEKQRLALARCLALEPEALLLDEPFAGLDAPARDALAHDIAPVLRGRTSVVITHHRDEALRLGDDLAVMIAGQVRQAGPAARVLANPADPQIAAFLGVENLIRGRVVAESAGTITVESSGRRLIAASVTRQGEVLLCLRAEDVLLAPPDGPAPTLSASNVIEAVVSALRPAPPVIRVELDAGFPLIALATEAGLAAVGAKVGGRVRAVFKAAAVHVLPG
jgi:tungstate transport system ATP-binding protein